MNRAFLFNGITGIQERKGRGHHVFEVDTKRATYRGRKYKELSSFERRKFENLVLLSAMPEPTAILYDGERKLMGNPK
jgi:hypothetical protein